MLLHYPVLPPSKLHSRVAGPFRVVERRNNLIFARDLTCEQVIKRDADMWTSFHVPCSMPESKLRKIAAADLGETNVEAIVNHRGEATKSKIELV